MLFVIFLNGALEEELILWRQKSQCNGHHYEDFQWCNCVKQSCVRWIWNLSSTSVTSRELQFAFLHECRNEEGRECSTLRYWLRLSATSEGTTASQKIGSQQQLRYLPWTFPTGIEDSTGATGMPWCRWFNLCY